RRCRVSGRGRAGHEGLGRGAASLLAGDSCLQSARTLHSRPAPVEHEPLAERGPARVRPRRPDTATGLGRARAGRRGRPLMSRVAVVGLGLIGGSLAMALRARGWDQDSEVRQQARERGIDAPKILPEAVAGADIVVTAVPTEETPALLIALLQAAAKAPLTA